MKAIHKDGTRLTVRYINGNIAVCDLDEPIDACGIMTTTQICLVDSLTMLTLF